MDFDKKLNLTNFRFYLLILLIFFLCFLLIYHINLLYFDLFSYIEIDLIVYCVISILPFGLLLFLLIFKEKNKKEKIIGYL